MGEWLTKIKTNRSTHYNNKNPEGAEVGYELPKNIY